ncbi:ABC transporter permease [Moorella naiadis]|uniref:ABC transporter permease n=1 Tax=Moorella naiadis (nom. illeg.) TaxID=3093670 RepID=UPI003D9CA7C8
MVQNLEVITGMKENGKQRKVGSLAERLGLLVALLLLIIIFTYVSPNFLTWDNFSNMFLSFALIGIVAAGMTVVIISGGFDLSVGSNMALTGVIVGSIMHGGLPQWLAIVAGLVVGVAVGLLNGMSIAKVKINPLITTLASMIIVRGLAFIYSKGLSFGIYGTEPIFPDFGYWGRGLLAGLPMPVVLMFLVVAGIYVLLNKTVFGREVYAIGGNEEAARVCGINVEKTQILIYLLMGLLAAFAGIILASRLSAGVPSAGTGYELNAIAAVVLGGASLSGGQGRVEDTILAVLVLGVLGNGFVLLGLSSFLQDVARGVVLLLAVGIDQVRQRRAA